MNAPNTINHLLFAYGSNMSEQQMALRCGGKPQVVAIAHLPNHQASFHGYSRRWDGAEMTVSPQKGATVWGVIYALTLSASERLDAWQDVKLDGTGAYFHYPTEVVGADDTIYPVLVYKKAYQRECEPPSDGYLNTIIAAAEHHHLPEDYVEALRGVTTKKATFEVPRIFEHERSATYAPTSCDGCGA
nr:gamma-glutamylcyclotransferase family protein [uncultured Desulfuromonas sp.]